MAKIVPVVQLAAYAKSSTLYGRTVVRSYDRTLAQVVYHLKLFNLFNMANNNINSTFKLKRKLD